MVGKDNKRQIFTVSKEDDAKLGEVAKKKEMSKSQIVGNLLSLYLAGMLFYGGEKLGESIADRLFDDK